MIYFFLSHHLRMLALCRVIRTVFLSNFYRFFHGVIGVNYEFARKDWGKIQIEGMIFIKSYCFVFSC